MCCGCGHFGCCVAVAVVIVVGVLLRLVCRCGRRGGVVKGALVVLLV